MKYSPEDRLVAWEEFRRGTPIGTILAWLEFREAGRSSRASLITWWFDAGLLSIPPEMPLRICPKCRKKVTRISKRGAGIICNYCARQMNEKHMGKDWRKKVLPIPLRFPVFCPRCKVDKGSGTVLVHFEDGVVKLPWDGNFICNECVVEKRSQL